MRSFFRYTIRHWRGEHGIFQSIFVNGFLVCVIFIIAGTLLIEVFGGPISIAIGLIMMFAPVIWAAVGIVRSSLNTIRDGASNLRKVFAIGGLLLVAAVCVLSLRDILFLFAV